MNSIAVCVCLFFLMIGIPSFSADLPETLPGMNISPESFSMIWCGSSLDSVASIVNFRKNNMKKKLPPVDALMGELGEEFLSLKESLSRENPGKSLGEIEKETVVRLLDGWTKKIDLARTSLSPFERWMLDMSLFNRSVIAGDSALMERILSRWDGDALKMIVLSGAQETTYFSKERLNEKVVQPVILKTRLEEIAKSSDQDVSWLAKHYIDPFFQNPVGNVFPSFPIGLMTLDGQPLTLDRFQGKTILVVFWNTFAGPKPWISELEAFLNGTKSKGFEVLGICSAPKKEALEKFCEENRIKWPQYWDKGDGTRKRLGFAYDIQREPSFFLLDPKHVVIAGPKEFQNGSLKDLLEKLSLDSK